jgi:hypothetical protein
LMLDHSPTPRVFMGRNQAPVSFLQRATVPLLSQMREEDWGWEVLCHMLAESPQSVAPLGRCVHPQNPRRKLIIHFSLKFVVRCSGEC